MKKSIFDRIFDADAIAQYRQEEHAVEGVMGMGGDSMFFDTEVGEIESSLRELIATEYPAVPLDNTNLVDEHYLDSLSVLSLASLMGERYGVEITYNEIAPENFNSVTAMAQLVARMIAKERRGGVKKGDERKEQNLTLEPIISYDESVAKLSAVERFEVMAQQQPDVTALVDDSESVTTYGELLKMVHGYAVWMLQQGAKVGDRVILRARPSSQYVAAFLATQRIGCVAVPYENAIGEERVAEIARDAEARIIIDNYDELDASFETFDSTLDYPKLDMPSTLLYTTGSTGKSKGVVVSQSTLSWFCYSKPKDEEWREHDCMFTPMPLNHIAGCYNVITMLVVGGTTVFIDGMKDIAKAIRFIEQYHCNKLLMSPSALQMLVRSSGGKMKELSHQIHDLSFAAEPLPLASIKEYRKLFPHCTFTNIYGSTEAAHMAHYNCNREDLKEIPLGVAYTGVTIGLKGDDGVISTERGRTGRICIKSPMLMVDYYGCTQLASDIREGEWLVMGDIGYLDEDGVLYFRGRAGDVINIGGLKISPIEVEGVAMDSGMVNECICIEAKDRKNNPLLRLLVVPKDTDHFNGQQLLRFMAGRLENYRVPKQVEVVESLARTFNGKLDRKVYRQASYAEATASDSTMEVKSVSAMRRARNVAMAVMLNLGLLMAIAVGVEYALHCYPGTYSFKAKWMEEHAGEVETLVMGPSLSYYGVKPSMFHSRAFSMANAGQTPRFDWFLLKKYSERLTKLNTIILPAQTLCNNYVLETRPAYYLVPFYHIYFGCRDHGVFSRYSWELGMPKYALNKLQNMWWGKNEQSCDSLGWSTLYVGKQPADWEDLNEDDYENVLETIDYNDSILDYCKSHHIRVVMPMMPVDAVEENEKVFAAVRRELARFKKKYPSIEYRDYSHDSRFKNDEFFDKVHLNTDGAEHFTRVLAEDFGL